MTENEEITAHPYIRNPMSLLDTYPGILQLLKQRARKSDDILVAREFKILIQFEGWTCNVLLTWTHKDGDFFINEVKLFAICKAPLESDQYEI